MSSTYLDLHAVHSLPWNSLNRGPDGAPKTMVYGGTERVQVSSQAFKRAFREEIQHSTGEKAVRTRRLAAEVAARLTADGWSAEEAAAAGQQILAAAGLSTDEDGLTSMVLMFLPAAATGKLAAIAAGHRDAINREAAKKRPSAVLPKDEVAAVFRDSNGIIKLFGRMLAELPGADVDAAMQVAPAFTTHPAVPQADYFSVVDDVASAGGERGAAHMGTGQYSSGTFYRYGNINFTDLAEGLDGDTDAAGRLAGAALSAFARALPTGKMTATAAQAVPELVCIAVRTDRPVSFAGAFEQPVRSQGGYSGPSIEALAGYAASLHEYWGGPAWIRHADIESKPADSLGPRLPSLDALTAEAVSAALSIAPETR